MFNDYKRTRQSPFCTRSTRLSPYISCFHTSRARSLNPNLKRIYLLRFATDTPLEVLKDIYKQSPLVEAVAYNYLRPTLAETVVPNDPMYPEQWNLPLMKLPQAWAIEKGKSGGSDCYH